MSGISEPLVGRQGLGPTAGQPLPTEAPRSLHFPEALSNADLWVMGIFQCWFLAASTEATSGQGSLNIPLACTSKGLKECCT